MRDPERDLPGGARRIGPIIDHRIRGDVGPLKPGPPEMTGPSALGTSIAHRDPAYIAVEQAVKEFPAPRRPVFRYSDGVNGYWCRLFPRQSQNGPDFQRKIEVTVLKQVSSADHHVVRRCDHRPPDRRERVQFRPQFNLDEPSPEGGGQGMKKSQRKVPVAQGLVAEVAPPGEIARVDGHPRSRKTRLHGRRY